jgi:Domain of unknown function (DUF3943)
VSSERADGRTQFARCVLRRALLGGVLLAVPVTASAEGLSAASSETFRYRRPESPHYGRAALEELIVIAGEAAQYWKDRDINSEDWDLDYDWSSFRGKLDGTAYSFDTNRFATNFAYHPAAGTLYYLAPRGNRLDVLESLGMATATSAFWEIFAEFRERVSINDMWVTPLSGLSLGETTTQLGAFFDRGCDSRLNRLLGFVFGPVRSLHDAMDGAQLERARRCDEWGFDVASPHRFRISVGAAQMRSSDGELYRTTHGRLETSVVNLPDSDEHAGGWRGFADGNVSDMSLALAYGPHDIQDMLIETRATVAGAQYHRRLGGSPALGLGDRALFGVVVGMQYSLHRYEVLAPLDSVFLVDAPAVTVRWAGNRPGYGFELAFDAGATFGGMDSLALAAYRRSRGDFGLTTIARQQRYNYVVGVAFVPRVRLELEGVELGVSARSERVTAVRAFDRYGEGADTGGVPVGEQRRRGTLWLSVGPRSGIRLTFSAEAGDRHGNVGPVRKTLTDQGLSLSLGAAL